MIAFEGPGVVLYHGDCIEVMRELADESVHAVVTDPPYGLEFMGREWDGADGFRRSLNAADAGRENVFGRTSRTSPEYRALHTFQEWCEQWAREAFRVLKPGGHLLAFGGSRTWHRLAAGVEDAGFDVRDSIAWLYGSGFPKSMDVSKAIDAAAGATREVVGYDAAKARPNKQSYAKVPGGERISEGGVAGYQDNGATITAPATDAAREWEGWGTALKPAFEPIVVARKPLPCTIAANVQAHGTGALHVDAVRVPYADEADRKETADKNQHAKFGTEAGGNAVYGDYSMVAPKDYDSSKGRWPTNVILDESQAAVLGRPARIFPTFRYEAKAPSSERPVVDGVSHPTVKPLELMRWLVRLVTPKGGTVLEPFAGSGTTVEAALLEGFDVIGIEREAAYFPLIESRITKPLQVSMFGDWEEGAA